MVKVCKHCSNIQVDKLLEVLSPDQIEVGCIEHCEAYSDKVFGLIDEQLIVCDNESQFINNISK